MDITHYILFDYDGVERHTIDEPIGFDKMKTTIKRGEYHGMSAEVTVGSLEFYGLGAEILRTAYTESVGNKPVYRVYYGDDIVFEGVCDLSTYSEKVGDYLSVSCKVGEIGYKTDFNARTSTEVDIDYSANQANRIYVDLPRIPIQKKDSYSQLAEVTHTTNMPDNFHWASILALPENITLEMGGDVPSPLCHMAMLTAYDGKPYIGEEYSMYPIYVKDAAYTGNIGIDIHYTVKVSVFANLYDEAHMGSDATMDFKPILTEKYIRKQDALATNTYWEDLGDTQTMVGEDPFSRWVSFSIDKYIGNVSSSVQKLFLIVRTINNNRTAGGSYLNLTPNVDVIITSGSCIKVTQLTSQTEPRSASCYLVQDVLGGVVHQASDGALSLMSDFYYHPIPVTTIEGWGCGASMLLTSGYNVRNILGNPITMSFAKIIDNLSAIHCIGWCFWEEDGKKYVRVEPWKWFYKPEVVLSITHPAELTREVSTDIACTSLNIGYKKYETNDDVSSINTLNGERIFTSDIKTLTKDVKKVCEWIADPYSIENMLRATKDLPTDEEYKYDENVFVLSAHHLDDMVHVDRDYSSDSIPTYIYNTKLSVKQNALRWMDYIFSLRGTKEFKQTSYKGAENATFTPADETQDNLFLCDNSQAVGGTVVESAPMLSAQAQPILRAEVVKVTYPITHADYANIKRNPYGIVEVDGEPHWIKSLEYNFEDGECQFQLIPKI